MGDDNYLKLFIISGLLLLYLLLWLIWLNFLHILKQQRPTLTSFLKKRVVPVSMIMLLTGIASGGIMSYILFIVKKLALLIVV